MITVTNLQSIKYQVIFASLVHFIKPFLHIIVDSI